MKIWIDLLFVCIVVSSLLPCHVHGATIKECNCHCSKVFKNEGSVCKNMYELKEQVDHVTSEVEKRTKHIGDLLDLIERMGLHEIEFKKVKKIVEDIRNPIQTVPTTESSVATTDINILEDAEKETEHAKEIKELKERLNVQEDLYKNLLGVVEDLKKSKDGVLPKPHRLVSEIDDNMLGDTSLDTRSTDGSELAKNMSDLLAKVEVVENLTSKVQEELKSERRVRRHLEEDLNDTRTSIKLLSDKLVNASLPMENRHDLVEEITLSTLENINKTLFEEQLRKLHYRLDDVAYKNDTKYLYEHMDKVRDSFLNVSSGNVLLFEEELRLLFDMVSNLNDNVTVQLTLEGIRLNALEAKTNEIDVLDGQLNLLMNASDLIHSGIKEMWKDIQSIRNDTVNMKQDIHEKLAELDNLNQSVRTEMSEKIENVTSEMSEKIENVTSEMSEKIENVTSEMSEKIENITSEMSEKIENVTSEMLERIENVTLEMSEGIQNVTSEMSERIQNVTSEISDLKIAMDEGKEPITALFREVALMARDLTDVENRIDHIGILNDNKLKDIALKVQNATDVWNASLAAITEQFMRDKRMENIIVEPCALPNVIDDHLLMSMGNDSSGQPTLQFGCQPIGMYVLNSNKTALTCVDGVWNGPAPECIKLLEEHEIDKIARGMLYQNPCRYFAGIDDVPDSVDCTHYFQCASGTARRIECPPGHHFSPTSKTCEPAQLAHCHADASSHDKLRDLIPPILIDPDNVDKAYGLMGTSPTGQLIVHPRTTFTLHCFFPNSVWGPPSWRYSGEPGEEARHKELDYERFGSNRYSVSITGASSRDSGVYMCISPRGKVNAINVIVKSVQCPPITTNDEALSNAYYRPHPEGESRILSTQVEFKCSGGFSITAICKADGTWSRPAPTPEECFPESPFWGCPPIDTSGHPNLKLDRDDRDFTITFRCTPGYRLIGVAFFRCFNGDWTHAPLPRCAEIFP